MTANDQPVRPEEIIPPEYEHKRCAPAKHNTADDQIYRWLYYSLALKSLLLNELFSEDVERKITTTRISFEVAKRKSTQAHTCTRLSPMGVAAGKTFHFKGSRLFLAMLAIGL